MKKILLCSVALFWWCLMFPSNSYIANFNDCNPSRNTFSFSINEKEIRFKLLDLFWESLPI